jgi:hypothetical protein
VVANWRAEKSTLIGKTWKAANVMEAVNDV